MGSDRGPGAEAEVADLARALHRLAGAASVRTVEALAVVLARRPAAADVLPFRAAPGLCEQPAVFGPGLSLSRAEVGLEICRRVARRALAGALADRTRGADAFHRLGDNPPWARGHAPVAEIGCFLFYRLGRAGDDSAAGTTYITGADGWPSGRRQRS